MNILFFYKKFSKSLIEHDIIRNMYYFSYAKPKKISPNLYQTFSHIINVFIHISHSLLYFSIFVYSSCIVFHIFVYINFLNYNRDGRGITLQSHSPYKSLSEGISFED